MITKDSQEKLIQVISEVDQAFSLLLRIRWRNCLCCHSPEIPVVDWVAGQEICKRCKEREHDAQDPRGSSERLIPPARAEI